MRNRIFTAGILILIALPILFWSNTVVLNIALSLISAMSIFELLSATKYVKNHTLSVFSIIYAAAIPFIFCLPSEDRYSFLIFFIFVFIISLFMLLLIKNKKYRLEHISVAFLMSTLIPMFLSSLIVLRKMPVSIIGDEKMGFVMMFLPLICVIITDTFALFTGMLFGKHKLAPSISPKKTVEGAVGGSFFGVLTFVGIAFLAEHYIGVNVNIPVFALAGLLTSVIGQFGDLYMSLIKRHCDLKDFGNLMPGHGGVLDRFDSLIFAAPAFMIFVYALQHIGVSIIII